MRWNVTTPNADTFKASQAKIGHQQIGKPAVVDESPIRAGTVHVVGERLKSLKFGLPPDHSIRAQTPANAVGSLDVIVQGPLLPVWTDFLKPPQEVELGFTWNHDEGDDKVTMTGWWKLPDGTQTAAWKIGEWPNYAAMQNALRS